MKEIKTKQKEGIETKEIGKHQIVNMKKTYLGI